MSIYLDANATCVPSPPVIEALRRTLSEVWGNPSSAHDEGARARRILERSAAAVCDAFAAPGDPSALVWTSGATEANNLALLGAAHANPTRRHVVVSAIEHAAVLEPAEELGRRGLEVTVLPVPESGRVRPEDVAAAVREDTLLVAVMHANNETGVVQPTREIADIAHRVGALHLCDAAQCPGRIPLDIAATGADMVTLSAHKFGGPVGIGALWVSPSTLLNPILFGGTQQGGLRPGTLNVAGAVAMGVAASLAVERVRSGQAEAMAALRDQLEDRILTAAPWAVVNGDAPRMPNTTNLSFPGLWGEAIVQELAERGVAASTAAVCGGTGEPSHVLLGMGLSMARARGAVRLSLHEGITEADIETAAETLIATLERIRTNRTVPIEQDA